MSERCALLLRAVNVGGRNRVPMAELRALLAGRTPLTGVSTYIASGNVICDQPGDPAAACADVRTLISEEFGVDTPVIARTHQQLRVALDTNPFPDAAADKMLHIMFLDGDPAPGAEEALGDRLRPDERIALAARDLWIDYGTGGAQSTRLTTQVLDRALGVAGTGRNLLTLRKLVDLTA
ncbi:DUF1697 domain-containing protein [Microbacterium sp.]|uniref:DUF1697 domain-containing protein n=1 Tax=Microbacterium sp. TaxID=51671 RepID=UPI0028124371|nr:DUF1697 domain-containing protein [Microbacterium sp.]